MPDEDRKQLNPQITSASIGVRSLRKINVYPLSVGDQLSFTNMIKEGFVAISDAEDDVEMAGVVITLIEQNIPLIIDYITDEEEDQESLLKDITNAQAVEIAEIVYEQNYASLIKKVKGLFEKITMEAEQISASKRPLQESVKSMATSSKKSTKQDSETVDSQSDK